MIRYVVRPSGILSTPTRLKDALSAHSVVKYSDNKRFKPLVDFFLAYPPEGRIEPAPGLEYSTLRHFFLSNKYEQRRAIHAAGLSVPETIGINLEATVPEPLQTSISREAFVIRPMRHMGGNGWRLDTEYDPRQEYASRLFPKEREYRVIYCRGKHVVTLSKRVPTGLGTDRPWNHTLGCRFNSLNDERTTKLYRNTDFYTHADCSTVVRNADLVAVDVMMSADNRYAVCEFNFAPSISIQRTLDKIKEIVNA